MINRLTPIHPEEILFEDFIKPMGISLDRLASETGVKPEVMTDIVSGNGSITADTALSLSLYFGISAEVWLKLQADYDLRKNNC